jgi:hypothetical protein
MNNKTKLPKSIRFGSVDPNDCTSTTAVRKKGLCALRVDWSTSKLSDTLARLNLMYCDRQLELSEPFSQFRKSSYFTPPTIDDCLDMDAMYVRVAFDFAKYMRDHYE